MGLANIAQIKEKYSVFNYARDILNLPVKKPGDRCISISGGSNSTAMIIQENWWYDFKTGQGGDVIDLCAEAMHGGDRGKAIRDLGGPSCEWVKYTQNLGNKIQKWHEELREADRLYLYRRGIKKETVDRLKIGFNGSRLVIPYWKNGYVAYYVSRERDGTGPKYKKAKLDGINENIPWGLHTLERELSQDPPKLSEDVKKEGQIITASSENPKVNDNKIFPLVITEGVFDALSFEQEGYRVLSPMGGYFSRDQLKQVVSICKHAGNIFLCFDSDAAGSRFQKDMAKLLFKNRIPFTLGTLADDKDISEYYQAGGNLATLIESGEDGVRVLLKNIKEKQEFKNFIFEIARFVGKAEVAELFDMVNFPKNWLAQIKKQALSAPPEDLIIKEVLADHRLKFFESLGFYEYSLGCWRRKTENEIRKYISDTLGQYRTGSRVGSVFTLLKAESISTENFNTRHIFNFQNCVLDLETGNTMDHSEAYMSSIQAPYDYDTNAYSAEWSQFIEDICGGDERKQELLQEIAGYVLFPNNTLQKCFFLIGEGANGKSVFLDVLSSVFGSENVSNVEMSGLIEPFQRIALLTSILNISSETQSNVKGAESIFKQIVVGDAINGCYKNKDFLTFKPRAKLISACNEYFKSRDMSTGFLRRICFVSFNVKFSDEPREGERKADKDLTGKLKNDLSAIFNWAYSGYKVLRDARTFTVTQDQEEMMENFMAENNPVVAFIQEEMPVGRVSRNRLHEDYKRWCADAGHHSLSRTKFIRQLKQTAKQLGVKMKEYRSGNNRGFMFPQSDAQSDAEHDAQSDAGGKENEKVVNSEF